MEIFPSTEQTENALSSLRIMVPYLPELEAMPAQVSQLRVELEQLAAQIARVQQNLICERTAFIAERRRANTEEELSASISKMEKQDYEAALEKRRAELVGIQNETFAAATKFEGIVKELRSLQRQAR
jgi:hypothetical protein